MKKYFVLLTMLAVLLLPGVAMANYSQDLIPAMTSNTTPSGIASASGSWNGWLPYLAFNNILGNQSGNAWAVQSSSGWLSYEFPSPQIVNQYTLESRNYSDGPACAPKSWTFEGWNGSQWIILDTQSNINNWGIAEKKVFTFNNVNEYLIYRINISSNNGGIYIVISEIEMMNELATAPTAPTNLLATSGDSQASLTWGAVYGATSYNVKRATTSGGPYTTVASNVYSTIYNNIGLTNGTIYYYVVTSVNNNGESSNSNEASATPQATAGRAVLWVTMANGSDIDYDLSLNEINDFISWYKSRATGVGDPFYTFNASPIAPYTSRTDYLIFDKIVCFKVNKY